MKRWRLERLKAMGSALIEEGGGKSTPSAAQAFLGAVSAGVNALIPISLLLLLSQGSIVKTISDNFSVRQITVTEDDHQWNMLSSNICFGINAIGRLLYSGQLAFNEESDEAMQATTMKESHKVTTMK